MHYYNNMPDEIKPKWMEVRAILASLALTQPEIAIDAGVSQAAVSRLLSKCPSRNGQAFRKLCIYAFTKIHAHQGTLPLPIDEASLVSAIREVWNGTPEHAQALAAMIRAAGAAARIANTEAH